MVLRKVLTQFLPNLVRAVYAEDLPLLNLLNTKPGNVLDNCIADTLLTIAGRYFYRIENSQGAYVGFMALLPASDESEWVLDAFCLRKQFRTPEYLQAFTKLVELTFNYGLYSSIPLPEYPLENYFTIIQNLPYHGKNFVILKSKII